MKPAGPLRPWIGDPRFRGAPLRGGGVWWILAPEQERGALARSRGECLPGGGGGGTLERRSGVVSKKLMQGRAWRGFSAFSGPPPCTELPPVKTWPPRGEVPGGPVRPVARAYRWPPHGLTDGRRTPVGQAVRCAGRVSPAGQLTGCSPIGAVLVLGRAQPIGTGRPREVLGAPSERGGQRSGGRGGPYCVRLARASAPTSSIGTRGRAWRDSGGGQVKRTDTPY